jgi:hypothetical protein
MIHSPQRLFFIAKWQQECQMADVQRPAAKHYIFAPDRAPPQPSEPSELGLLMLKEALINSQNRISYVFLSNAAS